MSSQQNKLNKRLAQLKPTQREEAVESNTFCRLCRSTIKKGNLALSIGWGMYVHADCVISQITGEPIIKKRRHKIHEFLGDGSQQCSFCKEVIKEGEIYSKHKSKFMHSENKDSCYFKYQRMVMGNKRR